MPKVGYPGARTKRPRLACLASGAATSALPSTCRHELEATGFRAEPRTARVEAEAALVRLRDAMLDRQPDSPDVAAVRFKLAHLCSYSARGDHEAAVLELQRARVRRGGASCARAARDLRGRHGGGAQAPRGTHRQSGDTVAGPGGRSRARKRSGRLSPRVGTVRPARGAPNRGGELGNAPGVLLLEEPQRPFGDA